MRKLIEYINESCRKELPEPLWDIDELEKFDKKAAKANRDSFSKESVEEIDSNELEGKSNKAKLSIGDIVYKDIKGVEAQPFMISSIRKASKEAKWKGEAGTYLITAIDAAGKYEIDVAQKFKNTDR